MLKDLINHVMKPGISDVHIKANEPPLVRYLGQLSAISEGAWRSEEVDALLQEVLDEKQRATLAERGDIDVAIPVANAGRIRLNVYRQKGSYAVAIRLIPGNHFSFEELHLPGDTLRGLCAHRRGLVLVAGITGAGKTTTLNAMINHLNETSALNIITIEDPVEFTHSRKKSSIAQREVGRDIRSYSDGLTHVLRQDPDVIVLGEIRTADTIQAAIEGASAGHLVLATIHASDTLDAVDRVVNAFDFPVQPYVRVQFINILQAIFGQRLVRDKTGRLLTPATEFLLATPQIKKLLLEGKAADARLTMDKGGSYGMHTFDQALFRLVTAGTISAEEALAHSTNQNDLRVKLQSSGNLELLK